MTMYSLDDDDPYEDEEYCIGCGQVLLTHLGEVCTCFQCVAQSEHDYDKEPNVKFTRMGNRIMEEKNEQPKGWQDHVIEKSPFNDLRERAKYLGVEDIASIVLDDPRFNIWSGSGEKHHHHYGNRGLLTHTEEVVKLCFENVRLLNVGGIDHKELFLGALYHDVGKMWDYHGNEIFNSWWKTDHCRIIHHIPRSAIEWSKAVDKFGDKYKHLEDPVLHMILSHHGQRQYGSPVMPFSCTAWLLHLCDNLSARMNDCMKRDQLNDAVIEQAEEVKLTVYDKM